MNRIAVVADDLTGAGDTGIQFTKVGLRTSVVFTGNSNAKMDVVVMDSDSRRENAEVAKKKVQKTTEMLKEYQPTFWYKKIDSTIRGRLGLEIETLLEQAELTFAMVCPAYPQNDRFVINGVMYLGDQPVDQTELSNDLLTPVKNSDMNKKIKEDSNLQCGNLTLEDYAKGLDHCLEKIDKLIYQGVKVINCDGKEEEDLVLLSRIYERIPGNKPLMVGSAGLAEPMSVTWKKTLVSADKKEETHIFSMEEKEGNSILMIAGSVSKVTGMQVENVVIKESDKLKEIPLHFEEILGGSSESYRRRLIQEINTSFREGKDVIITSATKRDQVDIAHEIGARYGLNKKEVSQQIAEFFGDVVESAVKEIDSLSGLFLTGGDVAIRITSKLKVDSIRLLEEVEPGIPLAVIDGGFADGKSIVTKAGAFGNELTLVRVLEKLKE